MTLKSTIKTLLLSILLLNLSACDAPPEALDGQQSWQGKTITLYPAKTIITLDDRAPKANYVAVYKQHIAAVGTRESIATTLTGATLIEDTRFKDKVIVPGFISQHIHPALAALTLDMKIIAIEDWVLPSGTVPAISSREDYLAELQQANEALKDPDEPLLSWGYHSDFHGALSRRDLDAISTDRAIFIWHRSVHAFTLNSKAIEISDIDSSLLAKLEPSARKQTDLAGGHFWEQGLAAISENIMGPLVSPSRLIKGLKFVEDYLLSKGITLASEPGGLGSFPLHLIQSYVLSDSDTPFRTWFIVDGKTLALKHRGQALLDASEDARRWAYGKTAYLDKQVKLFADGAMFSQTMQMQDGYLDGHHGEWIMDPPKFKDAFKTYWRAGYQIHVHQNGDAGLDLVLDTLEENMQNFPRKDHRTVLVHFGFAKPEQVARIAELGAVVSANPYYTTVLADRYSEQGIGPERANQMVRLGDVQRAGIPFALHSDMPMAPADPLYLMWSAVMRETLSGRVAGEHQRITPEQALRAVTLDAAYTLRLEKHVGSIEAGKLANFTVLEKDPLSIEAENIKAIEVWGTVSEGRLYQLNKN